MTRFLLHDLSIVFLIILCCVAGNAQDPVEAIIQVMLDNQEESPSDGLLEEIEINLVQLLKHPLDINKVSGSDLALLRVLNEREILAIISYRKVVGPYSSLDELNAVEGLPPEKAHLIRPFLQIPQPIFTLKNSLATTRLITPPPMWSIGWRAKVNARNLGASSFYSGNLPQDLVVQYRNSINRSFGVRFRQQEGESWRKINKVLLPDQIQLHGFIYSPKSRISRIALGDFVVNMGEGLIVHQGFRTMKSSLVNNINIGTQHILAPYRSSGSFAFMRGVGLSGSFSNRWKGMFFGSMRRLDATWRFNADSSIVMLGSVNRSGLHDTRGTKARRENLALAQTGFTISYHNPTTHLAMNALLQMRTFEGNKTIKPNVHKPFSELASISFQQYLGSCMLFGEEALKSDATYAVLNGVLFPLDKTLSLSVLHRHYSDNYSSIWSDAFRSSTYVGNERGIYWGIEWQPTRAWSIKGYMDRWVYPATQKDAFIYSRGHDVLLRCSYTKRKKYEVYAQLKYRTGLKKTPKEFSSKNYTSASEKQQFNVRLHGTYHVSKQLILRGRYEGIRYEQLDAISYGYLLFQDLLYYSDKYPIVFKIRFAGFDAPLYETRIFAYENGISGTYAIPFYYGRGTKWMFYLKYKYRRIGIAEVKLSSVTGQFTQAGPSDKWGIEWRLQYLF